MPDANDLITRSIPVVTAELKKTVDRLRQQGVPSAIIAEIMLRYAALMIKDTEGEEALQVNLTDTRDKLLGRD